MNKCYREYTVLGFFYFHFFWGGVEEEVESRDNSCTHFVCKAPYQCLLLEELNTFQQT